MESDFAASNSQDSAKVLSCPRPLIPWQAPHASVETLPALGTVTQAGSRGPQPHARAASWYRESTWAQGQCPYGAVTADLPSPPDLSAERPTAPAHRAGGGQPSTGGALQGQQESREKGRRRGTCPSVPPPPPVRPAPPPAPFRSTDKRET